MKTCRSCSQTLPFAAFGKAHRGVGGVRATCKVCVKPGNARYYAENRKRLRAQQHEYHVANAVKIRKRARQWQIDNPEQKRATQVRWAYGVENLAALGNMCRVCGTAEQLTIDHDHACCPGKRACGECVRGLLCAPCNKGLGMFRDNTDLLLAAIIYLKGTKS
jgi:hypothetical protein